jgi:hypothetical protein
MLVATTDVSERLTSRLWWSQKTRLPAMLSNPTTPTLYTGVYPTFYCTYSPVIEWLARKPGILMFLGLPDPHSDPVVERTDPLPNPVFISVQRTEIMVGNHNFKTKIFLLTINFIVLTFFIIFEV